MFESGVHIRDKGEEFRFCRVINNGEGQRRQEEEIIRSSWCTTDVIYRSTKKTFICLKLLS